MSHTPALGSRTFQGKSLTQEGRSVLPQGSWGTQDRVRGPRGVQWGEAKAQRTSSGVRQGCEEPGSTAGEALAALPKALVHPQSPRHSQARLPLLLLGTSPGAVPPHRPSGLVGAVCLSPFSRRWARQGWRAARSPGPVDPLSPSCFPSGSVSSFGCDSSQDNLCEN